MLIQRNGIGGGGGGGASSYTDLTDTPAAYYAKRLVKYNAAGTGLTYTYDIPYYITDYGAVADGQEVSNGAITSGTATLTSASNPFTSADVGKQVIVTGAGSGGGQLATTIAAYVNAGQVTLTINASSTVSSSQVSWGTDNTSAIQSTIDAVSIARGGRIIVPIGRFLCTGVLDFKRLPDGVNITRSSVTFVGEVQGPFEARSGSLNYSPGQYDLAPVLMITNTATPFMSFNAINVIVDSIMFYYPNQIRPTNGTGTVTSTTTTPVVYPFTVDMTYLSAGCHVRNCTFANSYDMIRAYGGRHSFDTIIAGNLRVGFEIDRTLDVTRIKNIHGYPIYDLLGGYGGIGSTLQTFVYSNSICILVYRADQLLLHDVFWYACGTGIQLDSDAYGASYGSATNVEFDFCRVGLKAITTQSTGWDFVNYGVAGNTIHGGDTAFIIGDGATSPKVNIQGGKIYGSFTNKVVKNSGVATIENVREYNNSTALITTPSMPASTNTYTNEYAYRARVYISGGTVTQVSHRGSVTGLTSGCLVVAPGETISITYSSAPSWVWMGM